MNARVLANGTNARNHVALLELVDDAAPSAALQMPPLYVVALYVHDRAGKPQHWSRTEAQPNVARELYDVALAEFIFPEEP